MSVQELIDLLESMVEQGKVSADAPVYVSRESEGAPLEPGDIAHQETMCDANEGLMLESELGFLAFNTRA